MKMKKSIKGLMISSLILSLLAVLFVPLIPFIAMKINIAGVTKGARDIMVYVFDSTFALFDFTNGVSPMQIAGIVSLGFILVIFICWLCAACSKRQGKYVAASFVGLFSLLMIFIVALAYFFNAYNYKTGETLAEGQMNFFLLLESINDVPLYPVAMIVSISLAGIAFLLILAEFIVTLVQPKVNKVEFEEGKSKDDLANEEETTLSEVEQMLNNANETAPVEENKIESSSSLSGLTSDDLRAIIRDEIQKAQYCNEERVREIIREELALLNAKPVEEAVEEKPEEVQEEVVEKAKIIRIPFETRIKTMEPEMRNNFNELKAEILSYGVKSRVSNSGDTFRLHTKTYVKVTIAGKSLKLYFALDPKNYEDSTLPISDASSKAIYKDIPLVFKVKSGLSLRRAKSLIADVMKVDNLSQGEIVKRDYIQDIIDSKK